VIVAIAASQLRNLFASVMLFGSYSLVSALVFVLLDAVDVAFTEAAVGAGIAPILMLATVSLTSSREKRSSRRPFLGLVVVTLVGIALIYAIRDLPPVGDAAAPVHAHVAPRYLNDSAREVGLPNVVTSVLASYRGYDTLGEVAVIFTAGMGVLCLLGGRRESDTPTS
jgi:multicomponent Na+:H+ antiporter subunit B